MGFFSCRSGSDLHPAGETKAVVAQGAGAELGHGDSPELSPSSTAGALGLCWHKSPSWTQQGLSCSLPRSWGQRRGCPSPDTHLAPSALLCSAPLPLLCSHHDQLSRNQSPQSQQGQGGISTPLMSQSCSPGFPADPIPCCTAPGTAAAGQTTQISSFH